MYKHFTIMTAVICSASLFSATLTVSVHEKRQPLADVSVYIEESRAEEFTATNGKAVFDMKPGNYTVRATLSGYARISNTVTLSTNMHIMLELRPSSYQMKEINVYGKRNRGLVTAQTKIKKDDIGRSTQSFLNDAVKVVQAMPGVSSSGSTFDSRMFIQGGAGYEWIATMDGFLCTSPTRWGGGISMFNPNIVDSIDLYAAGFPAFAPQGLAGILDVKVLSGDPSSWHGLFDISSATAELLMHGPIASNTTIVCNVRRTFYDFLAPLFAGAQYSGVQFPFLTDGIIKLKSDITANDTVSFLLYAAWEGLRWNLGLNAGEGSGPPQGISGEFYYQSINALAGVSYEHRFSSENTLTARAALLPSYGDYNLSGAGVNMVMANKVTQFLLETTIDLHVKPWAQNTFAAGLLSLTYWGGGTISYTNYYLNVLGQWTNTSITTSFDIPVFSDYTYIGSYIMDDWEILPSLVIQAGTRADYFLKTKEFVVAPRGGIKWEVTADLDLFIRGGLYSAFPTSLLMLTENEGNPSLRADKSIHAITGIDFSDAIASIRVEAFYKRYYDLSEYDTVLHYANTGTHEVVGGDIYLQKKAASNDWWNGWISYTYVYGRESEHGRSPETATAKYQSPADSWYVPAYLRDHTISAILELTYRSNAATPYFNWLDGWSLTFDFRAMSGKSYTEPTNYIAQAVPGYGTQYYYIYGPYNSAHTPWTHKLDIKITGRGSIFSILRLFGMTPDDYWYVNFLNVYNNENIVDYYYYVKDGAIQRSASKDFTFMVLGGMKVLF